MTINIKAILAATLLSYVLGSLWYLAIGKSWRAAVGWRDEGVAYRPTGLELVVALIGQLMMAVALSGLLFHMGRGTSRAGLITGFFVWIGFIAPSLATNVIFQRRNWALIWQDGLHWLLVLAAQGAVLGWFAA